MSGSFFKKAAAAAVVLVLTLTLGIVIFNGLMGWLLHSHEEVAVPSVVGKSVGDALEVLSRSGLTLIQESVEFDESVPAGAVLRQRPNSGMTVRKGRVIRVVVSKGGEKIFVPDVSGKSVSDAQTLITGTGLALGEVAQAYSTVVVRGLVITQVPPAGEVASRGGLVDLRVSKGTPPDNVKLVPDLKNKKLEEVQAWARSAGVSLVVQESTSSAALPGEVIGQNPLPDQALQAGMRIQIFVSPGGHRGNSVQIQYAVPQGSGKAQVRVVARDEAGEHEIFKGDRDPGETLNIPLVPNGPTRVRIYLNDVLVDEKIVGQ
jgi:serine/threonine-protein kinase